MVMGFKKQSEEDRKLLHAAIAGAEKRTQAAFALVVTPVSDRYLLFPVVWSSLIALAVGGLLAVFSPHLSFRMGFIIVTAVFCSLALLFDWLPVRLLIVPNHIKHSHCRNLAQREFSARVLADHQHRGGILFFVSVGERYAEILADRDLHARVGEDVWQNIVDDFLAHAKSGAISEGIMKSIETCTTILEQHRPRES